MVIDQSPLGQPALQSQTSGSCFVPPDRLPLSPDCPVPPAPPVSSVAACTAQYVTGSRRVLNAFPVSCLLALHLQTALAHKTVHIAPVHLSHPLHRSGQYTWC